VKETKSSGSSKAAGKAAPKAAAPSKAGNAKGGGSKQSAGKPSEPAVDKAAAGEGKDAPKRKLGLRGAAPWAARHAAKHAAEARARAAEPAPPGSARATIRTPARAEDIKAQIADLHNALSQVKALKKSLHKSFWDVGVVLRDIQLRKLYEAKGFGTFDAFLERELDFGKNQGLRLVRIAAIFQKDSAIDFGFDRCVNALAALDTPPDMYPAIPSAPTSGRIPSAPVSAPILPMKPPGRG
jgi:hypothetical protein